MVIFNSYVKLPEGKSPKGKAWGIHRICRVDLQGWSPTWRSSLGKCCSCPWLSSPPRGNKSLTWQVPIKTGKCHGSHGFGKHWDPDSKTSKTTGFLGLHGFHGFSCLRMFEVYCCVEEWLGAIDLKNMWCGACLTLQRWKHVLALRLVQCPTSDIGAALASPTHSLGILRFLRWPRSL